MRKRNVAERLFESDSNGIEVPSFHGWNGIFVLDLRDAAQSLKNENFRQSFHRPREHGLPIGWVLYIPRDGQSLVYETC